MVDGRAFDSIDTWLSKNPASQDRYPSTPSASAVATAIMIKMRERRITVLCLVPDDAGFLPVTDFIGRRGVFANDSLTRTRLASQEEQATCFQLIEEGCERTSLGLAQRGQPIVIMDENSSPSDAHYPSPA